MARSIKCPECGGHITRENQATRKWPGSLKKFGCPHCKTWFDVERSPFDYPGNIFVVLTALQILTVLLGLWHDEIKWLNVFGAVLMGLVALGGRRRFAQIAASLRKLQPPANPQV
jgi:hypothetical protein